MNITFNKKIEKIFYYIVLLLPISFVFGSAILNTLITILAIIFFLHILVCKNFNYFKENKVYFIFLIIFLIFQIANNIINNNFEYFHKSIFYLRFLLLPIIFKYFSKFVEFNLSKISKIYLIILLLIIFDLFYQYIFGLNLLGFKPGLFNLEENFYERYSGVFGNELILGSYLSSLGFLIVIIYFLFNFKNSYILILLMALLFLSIFLTGERSALISFFVSIFFILLFIKILRKQILFVSSIILLMIIVGINQNDQLKLRYLNYPLNVLTEDNSLNNKDNSGIFYIKKGFSNFMNNTDWGRHYKTASEMFLDNPINGQGFKQFRVKCKNYNYLFDFEINKQNGCSTHPHHYILEILSEQGILGLFIFLFFIIFIIKDSLKINNNKTYVLALFFIILGFMFPLKPSGSIFSTWFSSIFWIMMSYSYIKNKKNIL